MWKKKKIKTIANGETQNTGFLQADDMIQHQSKVVAQHTVGDAIVEWVETKSSVSLTIVIS